MSGQPVRGPRDAERFRKQYLASLDVMIANNEKNLQANLLHKRTGQVSTQITDYRTTSQKLADATVLKIDVKRQLRRICDSPTAENIVSQLSDDEVRFIVQHIEQIVKELQPKFRYGVDSPHFMAYLRKLIQTEGEAISGAGFRGSVGLDLQDILDSFPTPVELKLLDAYINNNHSLSEKEKAQVKYTLDSNIAVINKIYEVAKILTSYAFDPVQVKDVLDILHRISKDFITAQKTRQTISRMDYFAGDSDTLAKVLFDFVEQMKTPEDNQDSLDELDKIIAILMPKGEEPPSLEEEEGYASPEEEEASPKETGPAGAEETKGEVGPEGAEIKIKRPPIRYVVREPSPPRLTEPTPPSETSVKDMRAILEQYKSMLADEGITEEDYLSTPKRGQPRSVTKKGKPRIDTFGYYLDTYDTLRQLYFNATGGGGGGRRGPAAEVYKVDNPPQSRSYVTSTTVSGLGIKKKKIKGRGIGAVAVNKGVHKKVIFAPFGRYFINLVKLESDILCFSREQGSNIPDLKTRRVSDELAGVIRKMVNGGTASFNELSSLSREDKTTYAKILHKCHIVTGDGIEVPKENSEDLKKFEIMKGEILSGNDSRELIKQFKVMIIKLIHNGRLPKNEGKDLLMDLAELGY